MGKYKDKINNENYIIVYTKLMKEKLWTYETNYFFFFFFLLLNIKN